MRLQIINTDKYYQRETENKKHKEWPQWPLLLQVSLINKINERPIIVNETLDH